MSESLTNDTIYVQKTEDVNEKEEEKISVKEILTPGNTSREEEDEKRENLTETKDTTIEEVPDVTTDITKSPQKSSLNEDNIMKNQNKNISSPMKNSPQGKDDNKKVENLKKVIEAEEVSEENPSSSDAATGIIKASLNSSATHENQDISSSVQEIPEDKDSWETSEEMFQEKVSPFDNSSSVQETPEGKNSWETSTEKVPKEKVFPPDIITETIKSPLKSSPTEENQATDNSSSAQVSPQVEETDSSSKGTTETLKKPLKSSLTEENQDTDSTSSAQESSQEKDSPDTTTNVTKSSCIKPSAKDDYAEHVAYSEDGSAIYTDPQTKFQYKWCTEANNWKPCDSNSAATNPYENEHYKWCSETQKWLPKKTQFTETEHYKWDPEKNEWIAKLKDSTATSSSTSISEQSVKPSEIIYDIDEDGQRTYTDKDGAVFFWDVDKNAWFPKIDEDFMARYQMSYGFIDNTSESEREKEKREQENKLLKEKELEKLVEEAKANDEAAVNDKQGVKRKGHQEPPKWFDIDPLQNTKVYVSNLPLDITLDEFSDIMGKCGMIMRDPQTQKYKLKLYTEADGQIKGDGLCDYIKVESVDLALKILDEYELRGHKIRVQRAQFQMRGEYNPALKPKRKKKDKEKLAKIKEKLFDWRPEKMRGERSKHEKTVIIKNLFHPELFEKEVQLILDYQNDLREECAKCGTVRKVVIYDRHSEGVAQINMSSPEEADLVIQMMQGRFFGKRQLTAEHWDGKTKYKIEETEEEIQKRLNKWDQYLETDENKKSDLQKDEQDIEKTINFEDSEKSRVTQKDEDTQILEENL